VFIDNFYPQDALYREIYSCDGMVFLTLSLCLFIHVVAR